MPCTESKEYDRKYEQCLDEINELTVKYSNHTDIVLGDLNASLTRKQKTARDQLFLASIMEIGLLVCVLRSYPQCDPFFHHNDKASSQIDYILAFNDCDFLNEIFDMSRLNLSSHVPITTNLLCSFHGVGNTDEDGVVITNIVNWEKCDIAKYQNLLNVKFKSLDINSGSLDQPFQNVAHIFKSSAEESTVVRGGSRIWD